MYIIIYVYIYILASRIAADGWIYADHCRTIALQSRPLDKAVFSQMVQFKVRTDDLTCFLNLYSPCPHCRGGFAWLVLCCSTGVTGVCEGLAVIRHTYTPHGDTGTHGWARHLSGVPSSYLCCSMKNQQWRASVYHEATRRGGHNQHRSG